MALSATIVSNQTLIHQNRTHIIYRSRFISRLLGLALARENRVQCAPVSAHVGTCCTRTSYFGCLTWKTIQALFDLKTRTENAASDSNHSRPSPSPRRIADQIVNLVLPNSPRSRAPSPARRRYGASSPPIILSSHYYRPCRTRSTLYLD